MFTGLIEEKGVIQEIRKNSVSAVLKIGCEYITDDLKIGDSIAVNGVCLTATTVSGKGFTADVMHETINRSSLGALKKGSHVNLERAMTAGGRFGGHIVSGHIDGTGKIASIEKDDNAYWYHIDTDLKLMKYIIQKGSITIDGISLTVAKVRENGFSVSIIPHTLKETILADKKPGDIVNLENDCIAKYVEKLLACGNINSPYNAAFDTTNKNTGITEEFLLKNGF